MRFQSRQCMHLTKVAACLTDTALASECVCVCLDATSDPIPRRYHTQSIKKTRAQGTHIYRERERLWRRGGEVRRAMQLKPATPGTVGRNAA